MFRRTIIAVSIVALAVSLSACHNKRVSNPIANVDSKQPDKVLFDRAMTMIHKNQFEQARLTLQTLINTYPDSEFLARAKLAVADSWYAEGGSASWAQAEAEYNDFKTFFPNMPEAAEAQMKIGDMHFQQMEKPDRDYTHAKRAEDAYRTMILEFPDSKLVPQAKEKLREVQEVLGEREYRIGRFYYLRESYPAAIARLRSVTDNYELYSNADEALYMIGDSFMRQVQALKNTKVPEDKLAPLTSDYKNQAAKAFDKIVTRYPLSERVEEARKRLHELGRPVPTPTKEAIARNRAELESRSKTGRFGKVMLTFHKRPDVAEAAHVGEPTLTDAKPTSAPEISKPARDYLTGLANGQGTQNVTVEKAGANTPAPNQPIPRSDDAAPEKTGIQELTPTTSGAGGSTVQATPGTTTPTTTAPAAPPAQVNDAGTQSSTAQSSTSKTQDESSSKKKKKKKLGLF